jgi:uncharacterized membrane-anchored protein
MPGPSTSSNARHIRDAKSAAKNPVKNPIKPINAMTHTYSSLNHPLRVPLAAEVHSRPFLRLDAPETLTHMAVYARHDAGPDTSDVTSQHAMLVALCTHFGVAAPGPDAKYFFHDFGRFRLKWECHTEFATFTFAERHDENFPLADAFARVPLFHIPQDWLAGLRGKSWWRHTWSWIAHKALSMFSQTACAMFLKEACWLAAMC